MADRDHASIKNYTEVETWAVEDLIDAVNNPTPIKKKSVTVPKYQRSLVWPKKMKKAFISSIKSGYPIGSLLLYKIGESDGITQYNLIDGLQRTSTLLDYSKNATKFFGEEDIEEVFLNEVLELVNDEDAENEKTRKELINTSVKWVKELKGFSESDGFSSFALASEILRGLDLNLDDHKLLEILVNIVMPFVEKIKEEADISGVTIPIVVYYGEESNLPEIFERINSQGTKLNKYQIYAATWSAQYGAFKIKDRTIKDFIKGKYDSLIEEGLQVDAYDTNPSTFYSGEFTYFEYVFGLGKFLSQRYPDLFGEFDENKNVDATESIGFNLATICLGIDLKKINSLPEKLQALFSTADGQAKFLAAITEATTFVSTVLKPYIALQANKKKGRVSKFPIYHTELQIVSLIGKVFVSKYDLDTLDERPEWNPIKKDLLENTLAYHYLYDIVRGFWKGSGDLKANTAALFDSRYDKALTQSNWNNVLDEWFDGLIQRREISRVAFKNVEILFLKYIYTHLLTAYQDLGRTEFEIEHLVPVARLKRIAGEYQGLPISAISNLCLLTKEINQDKEDLTLYEYFDKEIDQGTVTKEQADEQIADIEYYTFTERNDLEFIRSEETFDQDAYIEYLLQRYEILKQKFYSLNGIL